MGMLKNQAFLNAYTFHRCIVLLGKDHTLLPKFEELSQKPGCIKRRLWLKRVKNVHRHYLETGLYGSYDTAGIIDGEFDNTPVALFEDTKLKEEPDDICLELRMIVGGKRFAVSSVFPRDATLTPTEKLLSLIDKEQDTERNSF
ncbi:hypothetical protein [Aneurinibacillus terranovensis]|uniref:hypothetical protein n=1 Tax=Aneurinibacillus terranovensis TaxID=278991 RepID=UPI0004259054|nr:hypothetical protein [Aneurinibacillus terranovensis]